MTSFCGCSFADASKDSEDLSVSKSGFYFDTVITITLYGTDDASYIDQCFILAEEYENLLSSTIEGSDISNINANPLQYVEVDPKTIEVLQKGIEYCKLSQGSFDLTIGALTDRWNISELANLAEDESIEDTGYELPTQEEIDALLSHVNYENIRIDGNTVCLNDAEAKLDLGGIAKGYIADQMKTYLNDQGINRGILNLGGNILTLGPKADGNTYCLGILDPFSASGEAICSLNLEDSSLVTSGIYERYITIDGVTYHHIIDTNTGYPADTDLVSATIVSASSTDGDALSTICICLGSQRAMDLINSLDDMEAVFITEDQEVIYTDGLKDVIQVND